jgi:DNA-binding NarL/FixJ family response regulator
VSYTYIKMDRGDNMWPIRVLIADDHPSFRRGVRRVYGLERSWEAVGKVQSGHGAVVLAHQLQPDVILMNAEMPVLDGVEATQSIATQSLSPRVIALATSPKDRRVLGMIRTGAYICMPREAAGDDFIKAIRVVHRVRH